MERGGLNDFYNDRGADVNYKPMKPVKRKPKPTTKKGK